MGKYGALLYRKKPVVIETIRLTADNSSHIQAWMKDRGDIGSTWDADKQILFIPTLEGRMEASVGDYIIRGVKNEFYPCKPDIFEATYEPEDSV